MFLFTTAGDVHADAMTDFEAGFKAMNEGDMESAYGFYSHAIEAGVLGQEDLAEAYLQKCIANSKDYNEALQDCSRAIAMATSIGGLYAEMWLGAMYLARSGVYENLGQYQNALNDLQMIKANDPEGFMPTDFYISLIYSTALDDNIRDGQKALEHAQKLKESSDLDFPVEELHSLFAAAYAEMGNFEKAVKEQETAISLQGDNVLPEDLRWLELYKKGQPRRDKPE
jgi:tetratricopeptide (TPR) repeat protein